MCRERYVKIMERGSTKPKKESIQNYRGGLAMLATGRLHGGFSKICPFWPVRITELWAIHP